MSTKKKLLKKIMSGEQDGNVTFDEALQLLRALGYNVRPGKGSHTIISYTGSDGIINLQPKKDGKAKGYQLDQLRTHIRQNGLDRE